MINDIIGEQNSLTDASIYVRTSLLYVWEISIKNEFDLNTNISFNQIFCMRVEKNDSRHIYVIDSSGYGVYVEIAVQLYIIIIIIYIYIGDRPFNLHSIKCW